MAVIYARKTSRKAQVAVRDINAMLSHASGENILVELEIDGDKANRMALVQEVQHSPVRRYFTRRFSCHLNGRENHAEVPLETVGTANGVILAAVEQSLRTLPIECLPRDLPDRVTVDVSAMNIGDTIHVRDISCRPE
jgi:large subunit ribosomal protein L25